MPPVIVGFFEERGNWVSSQRGRNRRRGGALAVIRIVLASAVGAIMLAGAFTVVNGGKLTLPTLPTVEASASEQQLSELGVRVFDPAAPEYNRDAFGQRWSDDVSVEFGHNGCDTRNDILRRDLRGVVIKDGTQGCVALAGTLHDPYTGTRIDFVRGQGTSEQVQIDHVVALADAWYSGAHAWDDGKRRNFANDPMNLQATFGKENQSKSAKTADNWLPSDANYHCTYAQRQVLIKHTYGLQVTVKERLALRKALQTCNN